MKRYDPVGEVRLGSVYLTIYGDLDDPWFVAGEVAENLGHSNPTIMVRMCEIDEYETGLVFTPYEETPGQRPGLNFSTYGQDRITTLISETGLYNILSRTRIPEARHWRSAVFRQLRAMRRLRGLDIAQQFEEWSDFEEDVWYDEMEGKLFRAVTVPGGDVEKEEVDAG